MKRDERDLSDKRDASSAVGEAMLGVAFLVLVIVVLALLGADPPREIGPLPWMMK